MSVPRRDHDRDVARDARLAGEADDRARLTGVEVSELAQLDRLVRFDVTELLLSAENPDPAGAAGRRPAL